MLPFIVWLFATEIESHMMVTMELMMKERNIFLWREILWQLRLLEGTTEKERNLRSLVHYRCSKEWVATATLSETVLTHIWVAHCDKVTSTSNVTKTICLFIFLKVKLSLFLIVFTYLLHFFSTIIKCRNMVSYLMCTAWISKKRINAPISLIQSVSC